MRNSVAMIVLAIAAVGGVTGRPAPLQAHHAFAAEFDAAHGR